MARAALLTLLLSVVSPFAAAQEPTGRGAPGVAVAEAEPPALIANALGQIPPDDPKMESYSHGNYVLYVIDAVWTAGLLAIIVFSGFAARLRRWAGMAGPSPNLRVAIYAVLFTLVTSAGTFPLTVYAGFLREKRYGFASQTFMAWLGDRGKGLLVAIVLQALFMVLLYAAIRRLGRRWWMAGSCLAVLFTVLVIAVFPVFIAPLFNTFAPLKDAPLRAEILEMARREGIPADEVYEVDASRQSSHNNAYVAGLLGTERIVLYDTTLKKFTPREIKFVMGHEMGHYVLHHIWRTVVFLALVIVAGFYLVDRISLRVIAGRPLLGITALGEPSSLPLIFLVLSVYLFVVGPAIATFSRVQEHQADLFGLEATHDPVAAASSFLKFGRLDLDEYHVHPWIEALLYSHPSLSRRIGTAREYARRHGADGSPSEVPPSGGTSD